MSKFIIIDGSSESRVECVDRNIEKFDVRVEDNTGEFESRMERLGKRKKEI